MLHSSLHGLLTQCTDDCLQGGLLNISSCFSSVCIIYVLTDLVPCDGVAEGP